MVTLLNASISNAVLVTTKGGISITDSSAVEKINHSNTDTVTLPNASIAVSGDINTYGVIATKGGVHVKDSSNVS